MKKFSKTLSLLLAVCMVMGTFCAVAANDDATEVTLPSKLLDLNLDNMVFDYETTDSGIVNDGTSETAEIFMKSTKSGSSANVSIKGEKFTNNVGGQTDFIHITNVGYNWANAGKLHIDDSAWETQSNTISFWTDPNTGNGYANIVQYLLKFDVAGEEVTKAGELSQLNLEEYNNYRWNTGNSQTNMIEMADSKGWTHVAITNPTFAEGSKSMDIYINGIYRKSIDIDAPDGGTLTSASWYFGGLGIYPGYTHMAKDIKFGDVAVYDGILTDDQITKIYTDEAPTYEVIDFATAPKLFDMDISGYAASETAGSSGIVNTGTSENATISIYNYKYNNTTKHVNTLKQMTNVSGGVTNYLKWTGNVNWSHTAKQYISDSAWENEDTTISFWMSKNHANTGSSASILGAYSVTYTAEDSTTEIKNLPLWDVTTVGLNLGYSTTGARKFADGFNHFVITNKKADADGNKTFDVYMNGTFFKSYTIENPNEGTITDGTLSFGSYMTKPSPTSGVNNYVIGEFDYGNLEVYKGILTSDDIARLYSEQSSNYKALALGDAEKMLELNLDNFYPTKDEESSGITNTGTSNATLDICTTEQVRVDRQALMSNDLTTVKPYIWVNHNFGHVMSGAKKHHFDISDPAWGDQPVTLSFWVDVDRGIQQTDSSRYGQMMQYDLQYTLEDGTTSNKSVNLWQWDTDTDTNYRWSTAYSADYLFDMKNSREWTHVAITIPDTDANNQKKAQIYINGAPKTSVTLDIPEGAELTNATLRFGGGRTKTYIPADMSVSDVKVYKALLSENLIAELYESERAVYDNSGEAKVTFAYDGKAIKRLGVKGPSTTNLEVPDDGTANITVNYTDTITPDFALIAVAYNEDYQVISAKQAEATEGTDSGSFEFTIPQDTKFVEVFVWAPDGLKPIQKVTDIRYNDN